VLLGKAGTHLGQVRQVVAPLLDRNRKALQPFSSAEAEGSRGQLGREHLARTGSRRQDIFTNGNGLAGNILAHNNRHRAFAAGGAACRREFELFIVVQDIALETRRQLWIAASRRERTEHIGRGSRYRSGLFRQNTRHSRSYGKTGRSESRR